MEDLEIRKNQAEGAVTMVLVLQIICTVLLKYKMFSIYLVVHTIMVRRGVLKYTHRMSSANKFSVQHYLPPWLGINFNDDKLEVLSRYASKIKLNHMLLLA